MKKLNISTVSVLSLLLLLPYTTGGGVDGAC